MSNLRDCYRIHPDPAATAGKCRLCELWLTRQDWREYFDNGGPKPGFHVSQQVTVMFVKTPVGAETANQLPNNSQERGLGDMLEQALTAVGVTKERVSEWLGKPCGCEERKKKLNELSAWAKRVISGKVQSAVEYLNNILQEPQK